MYDVKIPIKTTELAHGINITKIIIQNMKLVKKIILSFGNKSPYTKKEIGPRYVNKIEYKWCILHHESNI